ncbi:diacylglycerol kinase family lipid kinase [Oscillospiraceae bacterium CM]|nr:diacylglycerol kinase family lipid kinase [Oscillospiraceae bacterium CM]
MKHLFIINPAAGGVKRRLKAIAQSIDNLMQKRALDYEIYITKAPMDARDKVWEEAKAMTPLRVYACGGDGTLNECVGGAAGLRHVAVTHYPCGTGNDFVKLFGKADSTLFKNLEALVDGFTMPLDLIDCNGRYGLNICSVGIDARIGADAHKYSGLPLIGGATGYLVSMLLNVLRGINQPLSVTTPSERFEGGFALICACNGRFYGGGFNPVPDAMPDDGLLDFLLVKAVSRLQFARLVGKYATGRFRELPELITHIRGKTMTIRSPETIVVNVDGEILRAKSVTFQIIPGAISFLFPCGMQFFNLDSSSDAICV